MAADAPRRSARLAQSVESVPRINHRVKSQHVSASHCVARRVKSGRSLGWALDDCESVSSNRSRVKEGKRSIQIRVPEKDVQHISSEKYDIDVVGVASNVAQSSRAVPDSDEQRKPCPELPEEVLVHLTSYHESENLPEEPPMDWTLMTVRMMSASIRLVNTEWRRAHDAMLEELAPSRLPDLPHPRKGLSRFPNVKIFNLRLCMYDAGIPEGLFEDVAAVWPHLTKLDARRFCSNDSNGPRFRVQGGPAWRGLSRVPALSRLT
eukprot:CAMPEP_0114322720 /NCGR_PEP_ID=MMETSP0059-20121206/27422_1 /TAXON_ID=36894 /ORGANISM="Pyramimonas parkeae, Strain CCMP726" /LENGTH=263 /DNA_ID=CAMNT_0001450807 /DNA_START=96 /DNA_END=883 /DNA_ORIENTATION=-